MKRTLKIIIPVILVLALLAAAAWFLLLYRPDLTGGFFADYAARMDSDARYDRAISSYSLAWKLQPEDIGIARKLADTYVRSGNYTKAEYTLVKAIAEEPDTVDLYMDLCRVYVAQDKLLDAVQMLDRVTDPGALAALSGLRPAAPALQPESGYYTDYISVSADSEYPVVYLTVDGEYPSMSQDRYAEPVTLPGGETTVIAIAYDEASGLVSPAALGGYTIGGVVEVVELQDAAIDTAVRQVLEIDTEKTLLTSDLWSISALTLEKPENLQELSQFTGLRSLTIQNVSGLDFSPLTQLINLEYLDLSGCTISSNSLQAIGSLGELKELCLRGCALTTIDPLSPLVKLRKLDLSNNSIDNIGVISLMLELEEVNLANNPITSIAGLSACNHIRSVDISNCTVASLNSLSGKEALETLIAPNNKLTTLEDLSRCAQLAKLDVQSNQIADISMLAGFVSLKVFDGSNNLITSIPDFDETTSQLQQFSINYNQVEDISGLKGLQQLNYLHADYNKITDLLPLQENFGLVQVNVWDNAVTPESVTALQEFSIIVNYNPNYVPPEEPADGETT